MTPQRFQRITSVLSKRQPDLTVVTDQVHKGRNLSAIIRTCDAVGVDQIHVVMPEEGFQTYSGTSASAEKWVEVLYHSDIQQPLESLKGEGYQLLAANLGEGARDYRDIDYTRPTALVLGAEVNGISAYSKAAVDVNVTVPMVGMVESFNVSVASAIILMEAQNQRRNAGMYDTCRLEKSLYDKRFFRWAHPALASYCDENKISYPAVGKDGEVIDLPGWYKKVRR